MKLRYSLLCLCAFTFAVSIVSHSQPKLSITIDSITSDAEIKGKVIGLTAAARKGHKVVVYVKTDMWYIHPFADKGDGKSWASISADGSWKIGTVKRAVSSAELAALVIPISSVAPSTTRDVASISNLTMTARNLRGSPDFGKL